LEKLAAEDLGPKKLLWTMDNPFAVKEDTWDQM
jgi:hypothetical protein